MNLHDNPSDFEQLVKITAQNLGIREIYVEKDYWLTFLLKRLSQHPESSQIVFKGGTSLLKGYGLVNRFSEDIDLAIIRGSRTPSQVQQFLKKMAKALTIEPFEEVEESGTTNKKGMSRRTLHRYPRRLKETDFGLVRDKLLLEINCFGSPFPSSSMRIITFIGNYLLSNQQQEVVREYNLEAFPVLVLDFRTTFAEKILSLTYASFIDGVDSIKETRARVRHFYDLSILYQQSDIKEFLHSKTFRDCITKTRQDEKLYTRIRWVNEQLKVAPLHRNSEAAMVQVKRFFKNDLEQIIFKTEDMPEFAQVERTMSDIASSISKFNL